MWLTGRVAPRHVVSSQTRARTHIPCIGRQILNHCATREALLSPLNHLGTLVENLLTLNVRIYSWALKSLQLIHTSVLMPVPYYLDYCSFVVSFEIGKYVSSNSILLFQYCFGYSESLAFAYEF